MYQNVVTTVDEVNTKAKSSISFYLVIKRVMDIMISLVGMIFLIPIIIIVKVLYLLNGDYHSIFLTQMRIGKNGKEFKFYKFRTMVPRADEILFQLLEENEEIREEYTRNKKLVSDPRITKAGNLLRKTSLDELPQLLNVLKGDMSLVGNRPYLPREKDDMGEYYKHIIKTKPGITGYWQVNGINNTSFEKRLQYDQYYIQNKSLKLDLKIILKTITTVIKRTGAI